MEGNIYLGIIFAIVKGTIGIGNGAVGVHGTAGIITATARVVAQVHDGLGRPGETSHS